MEKYIRNFARELEFKGVSEQSFVRMLEVAENFFEFAGKKAEYTRADVTAYINSKKASGSYKRFLFYVLKSLFQANGWKWEFTRAEIPKISTQERPYLTPEQIKKLLKLAEVSPRDYAIFRLGATKGLRRYEIVNLKKADYKPPNLYIRTAKHGEERILVLDSKTIKAIDKYLSLRRDRSPYLFVHNDKKFTVGILSHLFRQYAKKLGLPKRFGWHAFRRGLATFLSQKGWPDSKIQKLMGWKTLSMVSIYSRLSPKEVQEEANKVIRW